MSRLSGGAVGLVLIPLGALVLWGGLTGNLAAILAALFAQNQLVPAGSNASTGTGSGVSKPPSTIGGDVAGLKRELQIAAQAAADEAKAIKILVLP